MADLPADLAFFDEPQVASTGTIQHRLGLPTASHYQIAIFDAVAQALAIQDQGQQPMSIQVKAVAGAGKTKTIECCTKLIPKEKRAIFLAFNKTNVLDLQKKLPRHVDVCTLNALGSRIWHSYIRGRDKSPPDFDKIKLRKLMKKVVPYKFAKLYGDDVSNLVSRARSIGLVPDGVSGYRSLEGCSDTIDFWFDLMDHYNIIIPVRVVDSVIEYARDVLRQDIALDREIDYDDQLYLTTTCRVDEQHTVPCIKNDVVVLDESQDLNQVQRALVRMIMKPRGLLISVGDNRQSIYGFRGADSESMDRIREEFDCHELPLSITYRCGKRIVAKAQEVYEEIEAAPNAADGDVQRLEKYQASIFKPADLVLCRNNAPLVNFAYKLIRCRVSVRVLGRDIGAGLIRIIDKLDHNNSIVTLAECLFDWREQQIGIVRARTPDDEEAFQRINDRFESIMVFVKEGAAKNVEGLKEEIQALFVEVKDEDKVLLSTIHKAKGSEADRVFFLDSHLLYPRWVQEGTWQHIQERNLEYVAITRARHLLTYIESNKLAS